MAEADFGAGEIEQHADVCAGQRFGFADLRERFFVLLAVAMSGVDPKDIGTAADQCGELFDRIASRADGGDSLVAADVNGRLGMGSRPGGSGRKWMWEAMAVESDGFEGVVDRLH